MGAVRKKRTAARGRFVFVWVCTLLALLVVAGKLIQLQVVAAPAYAQRAAAQRTRDVTLPPKRGSIYDREGEPLAVSVEARTIYATPYLVEDPSSAAEALAGILGGEAATYEERLSKRSGFVYIARKVDMERAVAVEKLDLAGIGFLEDSRRTYPSGELACQVLGFVGVDDQGLAGIEQYYDEILAGTPGTLLAERDPFGRLIPGGVMHAEEPVDGQNIVLTIDKDIQYQTQIALNEAVEKWNAASGTVVIMDPRNGDILAMASYPGFNPNKYREATPDAIRNRAVTDTYEPGSTVKSLTAAAVIDKGLATPDTMYDLPSTIKVGGRTIGEAHPRPRANWSLTEIVTKSSNVGAVKLGMELGPEGLYEYFDRFGLTEKTGVDFPGEVKGWLPPTGQWSASTIGTVPFGQGVSMTTLQLARALSAIANEGALPTPHFLQALPDDQLTRLVWPTKNVLSPETSRVMQEVMGAVITEGTGGSAAVPGYTVAGKTGTAQKARTDGRGYAAGKYVASFSGFLPAEDPQVLIIVNIDEPRNAIYGGVVAAPVFSRLAEFAVSHLKIPPTTVLGSDDSTVTPVPAP